LSFFNIVKRSNTWFASILIASALLLGGGENLNAQESPNLSTPVLHSENSDRDKSKTASQHRPSEEGAVSVHPEGTAEGEKHETAKKAAPAINVIVPTDTTLTWFTCFLVVVGFIQAWILRGTLTVSRAAERAYVLVRCDQAAGIGLGQKPSVVLTFKNFGHTPAYRLQYRSTLVFTDYPMPNDFQLPQLKKPPSPEMTISQGVEYGNPIVSSIALTQERINEIASRDCGMLIYGKVTYRTLRRWHYTNFAFFFLGNNTFIMAPVGNDAD
jgi:hypothetical protein